MLGKFLSVVIAGLLIWGVCAWRLATNRSQPYAAQVAAAMVMRPAPDFEALDANNRMFRLQRYLGRHPVLVVFFDARLTLAGDPRIQQALAQASVLAEHGAKIVAVSTALPQENRAALTNGHAANFSVISDVDRRIHEKWGRLDRTGAPLPGIFWIDRKGAVAWRGAGPIPVADIETVMESFR